MTPCNRMAVAVLCMALIGCFSVFRGFEIASAQARHQESSAPSNPVRITAIRTLIAKALNGNQIELRWAIPNLPKVASLSIFRASSLDPRNFIQVGSPGANLNSFIDSNLKPSTTYYYQLRYNQQGHGAQLSPPSNTAFATTPDGSEPNPTVVTIGRRPEASVPSGLPPFGKGAARPYDEIEERILHLLNRYRATKGLGPVRPSVALSQAADLLNRRLAEAGGSGKSDVTGCEAIIRARMFNFPNYFKTRFDTAIFLTRGRDDFDTFERISLSLREDSIVTNPDWNVVGIARRYSEKDGATRWVFDFADRRELSLPENMIGTWRAQYQISSKGDWRFNGEDKYDMTDFTMTLMINEDGTWVSQGYQAYQTPAPREAGTWRWVRDASRDEEIVTFFREDGKPATTIRVHAAPNVMTFFAVDGGGAMKNFFKGVPADSDSKDDPQIIFVPGPASFPTPVEPFPATLRCASCPRVFVRW